MALTEGLDSFYIYYLINNLCTEIDIHIRIHKSELFYRNKESQNNYKFLLKTIRKIKDIDSHIYHDIITKSDVENRDEKIEKGKENIIDLLIDFRALIPEDDYNYSKIRLKYVSLESCILRQYDNFYLKDQKAILYYESKKK